MKLNLETVWNDTYQTRTICTSAQTEVRIVTAIYEGERVICDLQITTRDNFNQASAGASMSADTMELLAHHLIEQAVRRRELESMLVDHLMLAKITPEAA